MSGQAAEESEEQHNCRVFRFLIRNDIVTASELVLLQCCSDYSQDKRHPEGRTCSFIICFLDVDWILLVNNILLVMPEYFNKSR